MENQTGIIFRIKKYALHDGPGIRTTIFLKGCPLNCWWCHNPEGIARKPQRIKSAKPDMGGDEIIGKAVTVDEVMAEIEKDIIFYDESGGGVTFSGGEPLGQPEFLMAMLRRCAAAEIHTAVDTSGFSDPGTFTAAATVANLVLFDLKLMDEEAHLRYTGVSNRIILENLDALAALNKAVRIRFPLIPTITDSDENIERIAEHIHSLPGIVDIDLLPYHGIADAKYKRLEMKNRMAGIAPPNDDTVQRIKTYFTSVGLNVNIGG